MQKAKDQFTAFERQDAKLREEVKHITTKIKKLTKQTEVCTPCSPFTCGVHGTVLIRRSCPQYGCRRTGTP